MAGLVPLLHGTVTAGSNEENYERCNQPCAALQNWHYDNPLSDNGLETENLTPMFCTWFEQHIQDHIMT